MDTYTQRGGVTIGARRANWPFGMIVVEAGVVRLIATVRNITLTPKDVICVYTTGSGVVFDYRTPMLGQSVYFESMRQHRLVGALREAGFTVQEGGNGFSRFSS